VKIFKKKRAKKQNLQAAILSMVNKALVVQVNGIVVEKLGCMPPMRP
jgi:hypothetical protein